MARKPAADLPLPDPAAGGRYLLDPLTGTLTPVDDAPAPTKPEPDQPVEEPHR